MTALAEAPGLRERKKRETRERLVTVAFELFQAQGYDATTLAQIAERGQVAARTVSNYFPQKIDLLVAYRESMLEVVETSLRRSREPDQLRRLRAALLALARELQRQPNGRLAQQLITRHGSYRALERIEQRYRSDVTRAVEHATLREGVDSELAALSLTAALLAVIQRWAAGARGSLVTATGKVFDQWAGGVAAVAVPLGEP
jgi:AcrR family transcriptional regulator